MKKKKGFTLVELLFVVAIIGVILALIAPALRMVKKRARVLQCVSRLHQINIAIEAFSVDHGGILPYITIGPEARAHPQRLRQPSTGVPSLSHFLELMGVSPQLAQCPADNGCAGQSYYPTPHGTSCFDDWGQSMLFNSSCYKDPSGPGNTGDSSGPLYGATPVFKTPVPATYMLASDFWSRWHFGASEATNGLYYTNILYFDGSVRGSYYDTERNGLAFLAWDGIRRWWLPAPGPFTYPE